MSAFLFLELRDSGVNALFSGISEAISSKYLDSAPHLTLRGPYSKSVPARTVEKYSGIISRDVLKIKGAGLFSNPHEDVVYLRVNSPNLRKCWWKPDYPMYKYGFNPHFSIYRGSDRLLADKLYRFFDHEKLEILCAEFRLVTHVSRQMKFLPDDVPLTEYPFHELIAGNIRENLLDRLRVVVNRHQRLVRTT